MVHLKNLCTRKNPWPLGLTLAATVAVCYELPSHVGFLPARPVFESDLDRMIPLQPVWIWPYVSYYLFLAVSYFGLRSNHTRNALAYSYLFAAVVGAAIFFAYPTTIPRDAFPLDLESGFSARVLEFMRHIDRPVNCVPSLHVAMTTIGAMALRLNGGRWRTTAALWWLAILYSTLATKQHFVVDVISGFAFGLIVFSFFSRSHFSNDPKTESFPLRL